MNDDLISREALLARVDEERKYLIARGQTGAEHILVKNFRDLIDNAPTVEITDYDTGYQDGCEDGLNGIRPQGKWIGVVYTDNGLGVGMCNQCGIHRTIDNFCPNCGADMRGEDEEEQEEYE